MSAKDHTMNNTTGRGSSAEIISIAIVLVFLTVGVFLVGCTSQTTNQPNTAVPALPTDPILGDGSHFDPVAAYPQIAKIAGDGLHFIGMDIYYVRSDGTLDLNASYKPYANYSFFQYMDGAPTDAPPVGAGGKLNAKWYQPSLVAVRGPDNPGEKSKVDRYDEKPTNAMLPIVPAPTCPLKQLWAVALDKGAPIKAVATIYYDVKGYYFRINDTSVSLQFDTNCAFTRGTGLTPEPTDTVAPIPTL